jgi:dihydrodipicolinate synthase/N-acetylneuraminate lyase
MRVVFGMSDSALRGAIVAAVTPLQSGGSEIDVPAIKSMTEEFCLAGLDGVFAMGTAGEGLLLDLLERQRAAEAFVAAAAGRLPVVVNCGAHTTRDTVRLAEHSAAIGAAAVSVIAPPYYPLDEIALVDYFEAAAQACESLPFFVYIATSRSGYLVSQDVVERLRARLPNLAGVKISDGQWERVEPYIASGMEVFIGAEAMISQGMAMGATGAVSGFANAVPELIVQLVHAPSTELQQKVVDLRQKVRAFPFNAVVRKVLNARGVEVAEDVRRPLRRLTADENALLETVIHEMLSACDRGRFSESSLGKEDVRA